MLASQDKCNVSELILERKCYVGTDMLVDMKYFLETLTLEGGCHPLMLFKRQSERVEQVLQELKCMYFITVIFIWTE